MLLKTDFATVIPPPLDITDTGNPTIIEQVKPNACLPILVH